MIGSNNISIRRGPCNVNTLKKLLLRLVEMFLANLGLIIIGGLKLNDNFVF